MQLHTGMDPAGATRPQVLSTGPGPEATTPSSKAHALASAALEVLRA